MPSAFDFDSFAQTQVDATGIDYDFHVVPDGTEGQAQIIEITGNDLSQYKESFNGRDVVGLKITWELSDDNLKTSLNMDQIRVQQDMILDLTAPVDAGGVIDWGTNRNQQLKDTIKAVGLFSDKKFNINKLKHQVGWIATGIRKFTDGTDRQAATVKRVMDLTAGRAAWEAKQAGA